MRWRKPDVVADVDTGCDDEAYEIQGRIEVRGYKAM
jgi:hypothetical protein